MVMDISKMNIKERLSQLDNNYRKLKAGAPIRGCSVIIPVFNQLGELSVTLKYLVKQNPSLRYEIIIVDDHSDKENNVVLLQAEYGMRSNIKIFRNKKNLGVAVCRNIGIVNARYDLLIFLDADMIVGKDFIKNHIKLHRAKDRAIGVGFRKHVLFNIKNKHNFSRKPSYKKDFRYYRFVPKKWAEFYRDHPQNLFGKHYYIINTTNNFLNFGYGKEIGIWTLPHMVVGSNMSVRKKYAVQVCGFNPVFKKIMV